tara:strand:- start:270 stop:686 length:417 start_codon:yes stop_codon:yes gene_type:complete
MGNKAIITIKEDNTPKKDWMSLYLHWNGGRDTVEPLLHVAKLYGVRCQSASDYAIARLSQIMGNYFGGTYSVGVGTYKQYEKQLGIDNGVYVVQDWEIVDREFEPPYEQQEYDFNKMVAEIRSRNDHVFLKDKANEQK